MNQDVLLPAGILWLFSNPVALPAMFLIGLIFGIFAICLRKQSLPLLLIGLLFLLLGLLSVLWMFLATVAPLYQYQSLT